MSVTDPIADMFTCIRNANIKKKEFVEVPASKIKENILKIMEQEGYIKGYQEIKEGVKKSFKIALKYAQNPNRDRVISNIKRISKPGLRIYRGITDIPRVRAGIGIALISTSKGLMTDKEARKQNIGGEVIGYIW
ncbi:MAG: 30S ribosomal protein S8 [Elusimicrobiota bacterium]|jgi:small subunit ribosomal protein S8|nr:30S ribosomal protein S8 [Elusimicrobiota bacterium]